QRGVGVPSLKSPWCLSTLSEISKFRELLVPDFWKHLMESRHDGMREEAFTRRYGMREAALSQRDEARVADPFPRDGRCTAALSRHVGMCYTALDAAVAGGDAASLQHTGARPGAAGGILGTAACATQQESMREAAFAWCYGMHEATLSQCDEERVEALPRAMAGAQQHCRWRWHSNCSDTGRGSGRRRCSKACSTIKNGFPTSTRKEIQIKSNSSRNKENINLLL
ncbi:hypothetical protein HAX54_023611, partial [Datura stramonium]|nr:hypothetical protein [Datura stramonium]